MHKVIEILIIIAILAIILLSFKLASAETNYNDTVEELKLSLNYFISSSQLSCNLLFDSGETQEKHVILCEDFVNFLDKSCRNVYYEFCFGNQWDNEHKQSFKNPDYCSRVDC